MMQSKIQNTTRHLISRLKTGHFRPFLALLRTPKKEALSHLENTKFTPQNTPKRKEFLLRSNRKTR